MPGGDHRALGQRPLESLSGYATRSCREEVAGDKTRIERAPEDGTGARIGQLEVLRGGGQGALIDGPGIYTSPHRGMRSHPGDLSGREHSNSGKGCDYTRFAGPGGRGDGGGDFAQSGHVGGGGLAHGLRDEGG